MKLLIVIRHGEYEPDGNLSQAGIDSINTTAEKLKKLIPENDSIVVFSSNATRA